MTTKYDYNYGMKYMSVQNAEIPAQSEKIQHILQDI